MRKTLLLLALTFCFLPAPRLPAQVPDPGAIQDREEEREKLLKASDQLDNIQANSEATKTAVDGMRTNMAALQANVTQLQTENTALKQQLADMQTAFDQYKADQAKARQTLIDNVAAMIAANKGSSTKSKKSAPDPATETSSTTTTNHTSKPDPALAPPPDPSQPPASAAATSPAPTPKPQKGYYHVVASGETLTMIVAAYRDNGVHVTATEIRKANNLTEGSDLKVGQKLFIPKPGTNL